VGPTLDEQLVSRQCIDDVGRQLELFGTRGQRLGGGSHQVRLRLGGRLGAARRRRALGHRQLLAAGLRRLLGPGGSRTTPRSGHWGTVRDRGGRLGRPPPDQARDAARDGGDRRRRDDAEREQPEEDEDRHGGVDGEQRHERRGECPAHHAPGRLDGGEVLEGRRGDTTDVDEAGARRDEEAHADRHAAVGARLLRVAEQAEGEQREERGKERTEDADQAGSGVVDQVARHAGEPEPLARRHDDREGQEEEGDAVPPQGRVGLLGRVGQLPGRSTHQVRSSHPDPADQANRQGPAPRRGRAAGPRRASRGPLRRRGLPVRG